MSPGLLNLHCAERIFPGFQGWDGTRCYSCYYSYGEWHVRVRLIMYTSRRRRDSTGPGTKRTERRNRRVGWWFPHSPKQKSSAVDHIMRRRQWTRSLSRKISNVYAITVTMTRQHIWEIVPKMILFLLLLLLRLV